MKQTIHDHIPPRLPRRFLRWYCNPDLLEDIEGDIHEDFNKRHTSSGVRSARFYYTLDVIRFFRPFAIRNFSKIQIINGMFKINTKIAFRSLAKNKLYSFINITGLAIGIAACLVIAHYVLFQLSFDRFHENADKIYRVTTTTYQNQEYSGTGIYCGFGLGPALKRDVPEIDKYSRVHPYYGGAVINTVIDSINSTPFHEEDVLFVEPAFLEMFSIDLTQGDPTTALNNLTSILISESMASKYFGPESHSAYGKTIKVTGGWADGDFIVSGVFKDIPANSHLKYEFLLPLESVLQKGQYQGEEANWGWTNFFMYAQLIPQTTDEIATSKIEDLMHSYTPDDLEASSITSKLGLESILDIHLSSGTDDGDGEYANSQDANSVYFMIIIAAFVLIIAWINFINLSTAKATERGMEVGIKKAMGAAKPQLIAQFLTEAFWVNLIAISLALGLSYLLLPILGETIGEPLELQFNNPIILSSIIGLIIMGPLLSGIYPAFVLSSFRTINALKGNKNTENAQKFPLRKILVVFQFMISTLLIAGTFVVSKQLEFMKTKDTGIDMSQILVIKGPSIGVSLVKFEAFKEGINKFASVEDFASSRSVPGAGYNFGTLARNISSEQSAEKRIDVTWVDANFMKTYDMELLAGRDFSESKKDDPEDAIISEAALKAYGLGTPEEAIMTRLIISGDTVRIRGVLKNHNWESLHKEYLPSAFLFVPATPGYFSLRINTQNTKAVLQEVEEQYQNAFPGNPLEYYFLDDFFNRQYEEDKQFGTIFNAFAGFAIFAACLGLFGLASYSVVQKAKEIGIRKVLGASSSHITIYFSKKYMKLILIANVIGIPIAYFVIKAWLQDFAFSIPISIDLFALPIILLAVIAAITILLQTVKASMANPVNNLRSE